MGTQSYAICRAAIARQQIANADAMMAVYQRQQELATQQLNQMPQLHSCTYNSTTAGPYTNGLANCF